MNAHRYQVGQVVHYTPPGVAPASKAGDYTIERLMPADEMGTNQYEIGCVADGQRRVVRERDLVEPGQAAETMTTGSDAQ